MWVDLIKEGSRWNGKVPENTNLVLIDVLSISSSIVTAFHFGCRSITVMRTLFASLKRRVYDPRILLAGERCSVKVPGFDFGNSPTELATPELRGKDLTITSSSCGGRILLKAPTDVKVFIVSFLNMNSVVDILLQDKKDVLIVCGGKRHGECFEDTLAAGGLATLLKPHGKLSPDAEAASNSFLDQHDDLCQILKKTSKGKRLAHLGYGSDIFAAAAKNKMNVVPVLYQRRITLWT